MVTHSRRGAPLPTRGNLYTRPCAACGLTRTCPSCIATASFQECTRTARCGACRNVRSRARRAGGGSYCRLSIGLPCAAMAVASCRYGDDYDAVVRAQAPDTRLRPRPQVPDSPRGASLTSQAMTAWLAVMVQQSVITGCRRGGAARAMARGRAGRPLVRARAAVRRGGAAPVGRCGSGVGRGGATRARSKQPGRGRERRSGVRW